MEAARQVKETSNAIFAQGGFTPQKNSITAELDTVNVSSYIVGGTRAFLKMRSYQTQLFNYFPSDGNYFMESICFYFMWKRTHFPSRDFIQQEV